MALDATAPTRHKNHNPFLPSVPRDIRERAYTLWWIPEGSRPPEGAPNVLTYRPGSASQLILRIYVPDEGRDLTGGVGLPVVTLHNLATDTAIPCTRDLALGLGDLLPWRASRRRTISRRAPWTTAWTCVVNHAARRTGVCRRRRP